jgi:hypothetical protein
MIGADYYPAAARVRPASVLAPALQCLCRSKASTLPARTIEAWPSPAVKACRTRSRSRGSTPGVRSLQLEITMAKQLIISRRSTRRRRSTRLRRSTRQRPPGRRLTTRRKCGRRIRRQRSTGRRWRTFLLAAVWLRWGGKSSAAVIAAAAAGKSIGGGKKTLDLAGLADFPAWSLAADAAADAAAEAAAVETEAAALLPAEEDGEWSGGGRGRGAGGPDRFGSGPESDGWSGGGGSDESDGGSDDDYAHRQFEDVEDYPTGTATILMLPCSYRA